MANEKKAKEKKPANEKLSASRIVRWAAGEGVPITPLLAVLAKKGVKVSAKAMRTVYYKARRGALNQAEIPRDVAIAIKQAVSAVIKANEAEIKAKKEKAAKPTAKKGAKSAAATA